MVRALTRFALAVGALLVLAGAPALKAAGDGPVVELPPLLVEDTHTGSAWTFASVPGFEFLSQCPSDQTENFVAGVFRAHEVLKLMIPESLQVRLSVPTAFILYPKSKEKNLSGALLEQMNRYASEGETSRHVGVIPGLRLDDEDSTEIFSLLSSSGFSESDERGLNLASRQGLPPASAGGDSNLSIQAGYAEFLMGTRRPSPPPWLLLGMLQLFNLSDPGVEDIVINEATWISPEQTRRLLDDPDAPRTLLPLAELFEAPVPAKGQDAFSAQRRSVWFSEAMLFIRWSFEGNDEQRVAAFRRFAVAACEGPVDESLFRECFGMDYARMRDELSDYLPLALHRRIRITGTLRPTPQVVVRTASRAEVARMKGDWERRAARHLRQTYPTFSQTYLDQSKATFQRAFEAGVNDPLVWGAAGLTYWERGEVDQARSYLERAVLAGVARPSVYLTLARIRYMDALSHSKENAGRFSAADAASIETLLRAGLAEDPPLPGFFLILSDVRARVGDVPDDGSLAILDRGCRLFPELSGLVYRTAAREWIVGNRAEAEVLMARGRAAGVEPASLKAFQRVEEALRSAGAKP